MKHRQWLWLFAGILVFISIILFSIHYLLFKDFHHIFIYTLHDIAFLPIEVLIVTLVIHSLLERQNLQQKLEKLNMVIGTFYSEAGTELIRVFAQNDSDIASIRSDLMVDSSWTASKYKMMKKKINSHLYSVEIHNMDLVLLKSTLISHEDFLLRVLENPVMLEHESFTEVLRSVFHLNEELKNRSNLHTLSEPDLNHLKGDIKRAYSHLTSSWLDYMQYLQNEYPYLFSLAIRLNPFTIVQDVSVHE